METEFNIVKIEDYEYQHQIFISRNTIKRKFPLSVEEVRLLRERGYKISLNKKLDNSLIKLYKRIAKQPLVFFTNIESKVLYDECLSKRLVNYGEEVHIDTLRELLFEDEKSLYMVNWIFYHESCLLFNVKMSLEGDRTFGQSLRLVNKFLNLNNGFIEVNNTILNDDSTIRDISNEWRRCFTGLKKYLLEINVDI